MAKKKIVSVNVAVPGDQIKYFHYNEKKSLLDYDIIIVDPDFNEHYVTKDIYSGGDSYLGKPLLTDVSSFKIKEAIEHWRREIIEAVRAGKSVFVLLNEEETVYASTGKKQYSGTGKNARTTNLVSELSNYRMIPMSGNIINSTGKSMIMAPSSEIVSSYWKAFGESSEYRILLADTKIRPLIKTKTGDKIVGGIEKIAEATGSIIYLPYIDFSKPNFEELKDGVPYWTKEAITFGKAFITEIVGIDKAANSLVEITPTPIWATGSEYKMPKEDQIVSELLAIENIIEQQQKYKEDKQSQLIQETSLKSLLYEKGKPLEKVIIQALEILRFKADHFEDGKSEFDAVFESTEGRLIGEAEGKDDKAINVEKLRQLIANVQEDFARDEVTSLAKGVLFGNAFRLTEVEKRGIAFTEKCITSATASNIALVSTHDLFKITQYLSGTKDNDYALKCRQVIIEAKGVIIFPDVPKPVAIAKKLAKKSIIP